MTPAPRTAAFVAGLTLVLLAAAGCSSGPATGTVHGKVTYKGNPVTQGEVHFYSKEFGVGASAAIDATGSYRLDTPIRAGTYAVFVLPKPAEPGVPSKPATDIPEKYRDAATSQLSCTIQSGDNDFPIQMTD